MFLMICEQSKASKLSNLTYKVSKTSLSKVGARAHECGNTCALIVTCEV